MSASDRPTVFDFSAPALDGGDVTLNAFAGQVLLIVNTASRCGFTPQYAALEALHRRYAPRGFAVLGFPCNQFGHQEPGNAEEIRAFCDTRYQVSFPLFAKVDVNGDAAHPLFRMLKDAQPGALGLKAIKWNFTKFLVDRVGVPIARYAPTTDPAKLDAPITTLLEAKPPTG